MPDNTFSNKRIAKNTVLLYFRMILTLIVSLFTVRVIFNTLGVVDYGIYNVVAGFVTSFAFLSATTSSATQRFLSYSIGKNDENGYDKYFKNCFIVFVYLSLLSFVLLETIGLWFLYNKLVIPAERLGAALWVYQSAVVSLIISFLIIPYNAVILSYERMNVYAYISIFDAIAKLLIVYLLVIIPYDHLVVYALLYMMISIVDMFLYIYYAKKIRCTLAVSLKSDREYLKEIIGFTGWNLFGSISGVVRGQGLNILINLYFGPVFNTARGIAYQVYNAVNGFAINFMMAVNPQIIKAYAAEEKKKWEILVYRGSKMSFSLLTIISFPLIVLMPYILKLWLGDVPPVTVLFTRLVLVNMLLESVSLPLLTLAQATGELKVYQIVVGTLLILNLPFSWIAFKFFGAEAYVCFVILIIVNILALFLRLVVLYRTAKLSIKGFMYNVTMKWAFLMLVCILGYLACDSENILHLIIVSSVMTVIILPAFVMYVVLNSDERKPIFAYIRKKISRK